MNGRLGAFMDPFIVSVAAILFIFASVAAGDAKTATIVVRNPAAVAARRVPLTFGQLFRKGEIREGVVARIGGKPALVQADVKRRYEDGSVRFAVISLILDEVAANGQMQIELANGVPSAGAAISADSLLKT